ncbi:hypothetical protein [Peribacillus aracenensis]|nr:hypothetical protein [Peribacillus sp. BBB004]
MMNCPTGVSDSILPTAIGYYYFAPVNFFEVNVRLNLCHQERKLVVF